MMPAWTQTAQLFGTHFGGVMIESNDFYLRIFENHLKVRTIGRTGPGPVLLFLHEALGCIGMWKGFPEELCQAAGLPGLVYDRVGHGESSPLSVPIGPRRSDYLHREAQEWLPAVLERLDLKRVVPVGHSDGGSIALLYAAAFPESVECLITEAAHIFVEPVTRQGIRRVVQTYESTDLKQRLAKYHGDKTDALFRAWCETWLSHEFAAWNIEAELSGLGCPALIMQGADDEFGSMAQVNGIVAGAAGPAQPLIMQECGHIPHLQARQRTLATMRDFLAQQGISRTAH